LKPLFSGFWGIEAGMVLVADNSAGEKLKMRVRALWMPIIAPPQSKTDTGRLLPPAASLFILNAAVEVCLLLC
jgi:hypothetical protein